MEAKETSAAGGSDSGRIAAALAALDRALGEREAGPSADPAVRARLIDGLRVRSTDPRGNAIETDMPELVGGDGSAMSPGSTMRAALGACDATVIAMEAARRGIEISELEVSVGSSSDHRGLLGHAGVDPEPSGFEVEIHVRSPSADERQLRELVEAALERSPVGKALERPASVTVRFAGHADDR